MSRVFRDRGLISTLLCTVIYLDFFSRSTHPISSHGIPSHDTSSRRTCHSAIFANFGPLKLVDMSHDAATGRHKGFCFIEYVDERGADAALRAMNGFELAGRAIKVPCSSLVIWWNSYCYLHSRRRGGVLSWVALRCTELRCRLCVCGGGGRRFFSLCHDMTCHDMT